MVKLVPEQEVLKKLQTRDVLSLPAKERRKEIQLAIMEVPGLDPDSEKLIAELEDALSRILPRVKSVTPLTDADLAKLIGRSRPLVQACISGRLPERLTVEALDALLKVVEARKPEIDNLIRDIKRAKLHV